MTDTATRIAELDAIIQRHDLNQHAFYQDWRSGTLPMEKLADYAGEYGRFVATIDRGWDTLGFGNYAQEEREHVVMWGDFKKELDNPAGGNHPQTDVLVHTASKLFGTKAEAVGALYAFEAQQPYTAQSKLEGLKEHYPQFSEVGREYFRVHASDFNEIEDLRKVVEAMSEEEFQRAKSACEMVCTAMWGALDGIYFGQMAHA